MAKIVSVKIVGKGKAFSYKDKRTAEEKQGQVLQCTFENSETEGLSVAEVFKTPVEAKNFEIGKNYDFVLAGRNLVSID